MMHDDRTRKSMDVACTVIGETMLKIGSWRERWRVEVDGCVFKLDVKGYPKYGTERYRKQQEELGRP